LKAQFNTLFFHNMIPWKSLYKPVMAYSLVNLLKIVLGSGLVGFGVASLRDKSHDNEDDDSDNDKNQFFNKRLERYIYSTVTIGVGIYFALPSLASQMLWESAFPILTATETAQGYATESLYGYIKSWKPDQWQGKGGGSGKGGGGKGEGRQREQQK
jgi:hypothetical protein